MAKPKKIPAGLYASFAHMDKSAIIGFLQRRGIAATSSWDDLWQDANAYAKTIAGETRVNVLEDIFNHTEGGIKTGKNQTAMAKEIAEAMAAKGWYFDRTGDSYPLDPEKALGQLLPISDADVARR